ncbi:MAG: hypothetical protein COB15_04330 [Flavobacteriales bacterium]|nr:MAG: hypothetical protein COB15_04330 [Flavobacteriales bacterium]
MKKLATVLILSILLVFSYTKMSAQATSIIPAPQSITICEGDVTAITFTPGGTCTGAYEYQILNGATVVQAWSTAATFNASNITGITYTVELRCSNSAGTVVSDTFLVDVITEPIVTGNLTICSGGSTVLTASGSTPPLEWWDSQTGGTQLSATATYTTPNLTNTTTYYTQGSGVTGGGSGKILITECGLAGFSGNTSADYLEVSNLYATPVNTTGWVAAVSSSYTNINGVNTILWNMPSSFNACSVVSRNDISGDPNYWGNNIMWNPGANTSFRSWAIIVDNLGNVVDFAVWGWTAADIATFNPTINGFSITLGPEWAGGGISSQCNTTGGIPFSIQRIGNNDNNTLADFVCQASTVDVVNPGLVCGWSPLTCRFPVTVTVEPIPTVTVPANATYCVGDNVPASAYASTPTGGTFTWTNSNTAIGLAANGAGNTPVFSATNSTGTAITATITVTPTVNGCVGTPLNYTITVDPTPTVTVPTNATYCIGDPVPVSAYTSTPNGATFTWTNSNTAIGLAANGAGNTPAFTAANPGAAAITGTITVTPILNGCTGLPVTYTITVNPIPTVTPPSNAIYCAGDVVPLLPVGGGPVGAIFNWTNSNTAIGLAANGTGAIASFTTTNTTSTPIVATITYTPTANGCTGTSVAYTITVNPIPAAPTVLNANICPNNSTTLTATAPGGTYEWYDAAIGGTLLFTGASYTTPSLTVNTSYWVQTTLNGCTGPRTQVDVTIAASLTVNAGVDDTICNGQSYTLGASPNGIGYTFDWDELGNLNFSTLFNPTVNPTTTTMYWVTVTDPTFCTGTDTVIITVNPVPSMTPPSNATYCDGDAVPASTYSTTPVGGTFTWTNSDPTIGLAASGTGNTPVFNAVNTTSSPITATISVTPTLNGCIGAAVNYTITVNPIPAPPTSASVSICTNNTATLTATAPGGTYEWYDATTGGTLLFTGASYTTPILTANTSYWVQTTINGCISPRTQVDVTIASGITVNPGVDDTICNGQPYTLGVSPNGAGYNIIWDEPGNLNFSNVFNPTVNPTATTTYTVTVTDASNCTGTNNVTITVNPLPTATVSTNATYCNGDLIPASVYNSTPTGGTFTWSNSDPSIGLAASGTGNTPTFNATNTSGSVVTATITVTPTVNGCIGTPSNYTITVNPTPTVTVPTNISYCNGDPVPASTYTSSPTGGTFDWTNTNGTIGLATLGTSNTPTFNATNTSANPTTATIVVTPTVNGCIGTPSNYTITINPTPTVIVTANATFCNGDPVPASAYNSTPSSGTFTWTNSDPSIGLAASGTGNTPAFNAINVSGIAVTATITVTPSANSCTGTPSSYTVTVNPGATANVPINITECVGTFIPASNFTSIPAAGTFAWTNSNPAIGLTTSGTGNTPAFTATNTTSSPITSTISVLATAGGCPGGASTYTITINPIVTASTAIAICPGDSILIGGNYISGAGTYSETLMSVYGCDSILTINLTVNVVPIDSIPITICSGDSSLIEGNYYDTTGIYTFNYTSAVGCDSILIYALTVNPLPSFNLNVTGNTSINLGESVDFAILPGVIGTTYFWDPPAGLDCIFCQNPTATPTETTWYFVTVTNAQGCQTIDSIYIEVDPSSNIYVPNIFSPNGLGENNTYYVRGKGIQQFNLVIFNRWGQSVFESTDIENGWDGTKNGSPLNQGVFVYKLDVTFYSGETFSQTGNITLVR